ncbi:MAG: hypothetical protein COB50_05370 [Thiotrichales bacterium]|nr:MAG: hypothetical protein COB50_05370 [Thiotrichales bacterium]
MLMLLFIIVLELNIFLTVIFFIIYKNKVSPIKAFLIIINFYKRISSKKILLIEDGVLMMNGMITSSKEALGFVCKQYTSTKGMASGAKKTLSKQNYKERAYLNNETQESLANLRDNSLSCNKTRYLMQVFNAVEGRESIVKHSNPINEIEFKNHFYDFTYLVKRDIFKDLILRGLIKEKFTNRLLSISNEFSNIHTVNYSLSAGKLPIPGKSHPGMVS